jgi:hypothetical protein
VNSFAPWRVAGAGFTPAQARFELSLEHRGRRGLGGGTRVSPHSKTCRCTGYVNIVEAVVSTGGAT